MSFDPVEMQLISASTLVSFVRRGVKTELMNGNAAGVLHLHVAGPSGRGKSHIAVSIARMLAAVFESEDMEARIVIVPLDSFGYSEGDSWKIEERTCVSFIESGLKSNSAYFNVLITEGTADNETDVISSIISLPEIDHTVCCVIEPDVYSWLSINLAKAKEASERKLNPAWISHWQKMGSLGVSKAIQKMQEDTKFSVRMWNKFPVTSLAVGYHTYALIDSGWFPISVSDDESLISVIRPHEA